MKIIVIRQISRPGQDPKKFRAYNFPDKKPLKPTASTTGNDEVGIRRCAAKAFGIYKGEFESYDRIAIRPQGSGEYWCTLKEAA